MSNDILEQIQMKHEEQVLSGARHIISELRDERRVPLPPNLRIDIGDFGACFAPLVARVEDDILFINRLLTIDGPSRYEYEEKTYVLTLKPKGDPHGRPIELKLSLGGFLQLFGAHKPSLPKSLQRTDSPPLSLAEIKHDITSTLVRTALSEIDIWFNQDTELFYIREACVQAYCHHVLGTKPECTADNEWNRSSAKRVSGLIFGEVGYSTFPILVDALIERGPPTDNYFDQEYLDSLDL